MFSPAPEGRLMMGAFLAALRSSSPLVGRADSSPEIVIRAHRCRDKLASSGFVLVPRI